LDTLESPAETFPDLDLHFAALAQENAIDELGRLKDSRAIDLLKMLMFHSDPRTRLRAVLALGEFNSPSLAPAMTRVVRADSDADVREAAAAVLTRYAKH
jgi:HEAT repeat protein